MTAADAELLRKLRTRQPSSFSHGDRAEQTLAALTALAALTGQAEGRGTARVVPDVGVHALVDQLQVLIDEARRAQVSADQVERIVRDLAEELGVLL